MGNLCNYSCDLVTTNNNDVSSLGNWNECDRKFINLPAHKYQISTLLKNNYTDCLLFNIYRTFMNYVEAMTSTHARSISLQNMILLPNFELKNVNFSNFQLI